MATKLKPATKKPAAAPAAKAAAPKGKAKPANTNAAKPKKEAVEVTYAEKDFVKFLGYKSDVGDDAVFAENDNLIIIEVEDNGDKGILYSAVKAEDYPTFLETPDEVSGGQVAGSEITAIKGGALTELKERFLPIVMVGELENILSSHESAIEAAIDLNNEAQESYFYLGGVLAKILQEGSYLKENGGEYEGDDAFNDFCEETFGFNHHKARDLARIYTTFSVIPDFKPEMLQNVGWSKARAIQRYVTPENVNELIEKAEESTQRDLPVILKESYSNAEGKTPSGAAASRGATIKKVAITFKLVEDAANGVNMALEEVMKEKGLKDISEALEHIVMTYASEHIGSEQKQKRVVAKLNKGAALKAKAA